ncbi:MAG: alcohol dehydrogenase catalytic domain-containing protein [bacterium]|nr:alcohol dehydrogenase catalytic domain-containing protein [bacterium]
MSSRARTSGTTVRAAVWDSPRSSLSVEDVLLADPASGEVGVRVVATAICGSDLAYVDGHWASASPAVFGHEAAGVVDRLGPGVTDLAVGDRVVVTLIRSCGSCRRCLAGAPVGCSGRFALDECGPLRGACGSEIWQGLAVAAFAEAVTVHRSQVVWVGPEIALDVAALLSCGVLAGVGAVRNTARVEPGSSVVVLGAGGVGLNVVQGARLAGAAKVIAVDPDQCRLAAALRLGASAAVAVGGDVQDEVRAATDGEMADYVFVATAAVSAIETGLDLLARMGTLVLVGMPPSGARVSLDPVTVASRGQRILGSKMGSARPDRDIPALAALYREGRLELDGLITGRYALDEIEEALGSSRSGDTLRNVIITDESLIA